MLPLLLAAATDKSSRLFAETLPWILVLLGVIVVGGVIIFIARRYVHSGDGAAAGGFTLQDLREMHKAGEISDEEFARAKAQMIGRMAVDNNAKPDAGDGVSTGNAPPTNN
ncbi:MAG TPA: SHOCT domain-containing protein [Phycisphaerales bacterium]|jgi:hypothetical protein|nr:SHOCT domain-containing protein [Phycisphaerales bacterium]